MADDKGNAMPLLVPTRADRRPQFLWDRPECDFLTRGIVMAIHHYPVEVQSDHLEKITRANPIQALSELIWNGLDADATRVCVTFESNDLGALDRVTVSDNGDGLSYADAPDRFRRLGGSWKRPGATTVNGRFLHGQEGRGRFKAFAIGSFAEWSVTYRRENKCWSYTITMSGSDIRRVSISDEVEVKASAETGITLTVTEPIKDFRFFDGGSALAELTQIFALYLADYGNVTILVGGQRIDPATVIAGRKAINLADIEVLGKAHPVRVEIVEWNGVSNRALFLCNEKRFPLAKVDRRFHIGNFQFSAYLQTSYLSVAQHEGTVELAEMQPPIVAAIDDAIQAIKDYFRNRAAEEARSFVQEWKAESIYPYEGEAISHVEQVERQVFDIVALNVARHLPDFADSPPKNRAFQLRMLRQAIERSPDDLQLILTEVLNLPKRKRDELSELLRDVSLSSIISAAKVVADRLKFIAGLDALLFDPEPKKRLKERSQLHRIVAENCWLFGEEYALSVDDQSLTEVLRSHKRLLGEEVVIDTPVKHISKTRGIVDLVLSKAIRQHRANALTHLVVELKAPKVPINTDEISQIEGYAASITNDVRFRNVGVNWAFWVISDELGPHAKFRIGDEPTGLIHKAGNVSIFIKTWGQVLDENRSRLQFFQERLEYKADKGESLKHLQERHARYLEGVFDDEREHASTDDEVTEAVSE